MMSRDKNSHLRLADRPADYRELGIDTVEVAQFEDGQRIGTEKGRYEWWYFDAHLDDGATVVAIFYTKPNVSPNGPLAPRITINLTLPDGRFRRRCQKLSLQPRRSNADDSYQERSRFTKTYWRVGYCVMWGKYVNNCAPKSPPRCFSCARPMQLVRRTPRFGGLPDLCTFECRECGVWHIEEGDAAEGRLTDLAAALAA
jgi:hypothetical protein